MQTVHIVLGPTASGKTDYSIALAHKIQKAEIINADSRQLYKYLDIGTAKISTGDMHGIQHHLIDVLDPTEEATAGWYQTEANRIIKEVHERGNVPILVGGSMLYVSAVIDGLSMAPEADPAIRKKLLEEYERDEGASLYKRLQEIDSETAAAIHPNNKPRLIRAVEIFELTKQPKSSAVPRSELRTGKGTTHYEFRITGMEWPREELVDRINARTKKMFENGWIKEVQQLIDKGYTTDDPGMKSHGYREIMYFVEHGEPSSIEELQEMIAAKTRQYAKRQVTWWKTDPRIRWVPQAKEVLV